MFFWIEAIRTTLLLFTLLHLFDRFTPKADYTLRSLTRSVESFECLMSRSGQTCLKSSTFITVVMQTQRCCRLLTTTTMRLHASNFIIVRQSWCTRLTIKTFKKWRNILFPYTCLLKNYNVCNT